MQILLLLLTLFSCSKIFACSEIMKPYSEECLAQDRYQKLTMEFSSFSINVTDLKEFKIPRTVALSKNEEWKNLSKGQKYINELSPIFFELSDVTKLHKILFDENSSLRTNNGETNPKLILSCSDRILDDNLINLLTDYDLKSTERYPLLTLENIKSCGDKNFSSADLYFYKGASVKTEIVRWLIDLSDMISRYENGIAPADLSPFNYLSDMRRWFLAIRPFNFGNEEVAAVVIDHVATRLQLPPLPFRGQGAPIYLSVNENREVTIKKIQETFTFFEACLNETKARLVSSECAQLSKF